MELKRVFFFSLGATLLSVGAAGVFIPLLPTTPFVLASVFCFGKSSKRTERWVSNNRYFGSYIENYKTNQGVPLDVKIKSIVFLWIMLICSSIIFFNHYIPIIMTSVGIIVTAHILLLKTKRSSNFMDH